MKIGLEGGGEACVISNLLADNLRALGGLAVKEKATCELDEERESVFYYITLH